MFESLKKKFTGTIGKLSDKITEEEKLEALENKSSEKIEESKNLKEPVNSESTDNTVEKVPESENESVNQKLLNRIKIILVYHLKQNQNLRHLKM